MLLWNVRKAEVRKYKPRGFPLTPVHRMENAEFGQRRHFTGSQTGHILRWRSVTGAKNHEVPKPITSTALSSCRSLWVTVPRGAPSMPSWNCWSASGASGPQFL